MKNYFNFSKNIAHKMKKNTIIFYLKLKIKKIFLLKKNKKSNRFLTPIEFKVQNLIEEND